MNAALLRLGLGMVLVVVGVARARAAAPVVPDRVRSVIRQRVDIGYNIGIVVGMINADGRVYFSSGSTAIGQTNAPDARTLFEIGSITKVFTTTLLADAVQRGEVGLTDPVQSLLPAEVRVPSGPQRAIQLEDLATQRSGLPNNPTNLCPSFYEPFACYSTGRLYEFLNGHTLAREPGSQWEYSNLGLGLLGHALAQRAGKSWEALLKERVLDPLGLTNTAIHFPPAATSRLAQSHSGVLVRPPFEMPGLEGAGALRSCAEDLLNFLAYQMELSPSPLAPALRDTRTRRAATTYAGIDIGLGWWLWNLTGGVVVQHGGETPGQTAVLAFHPEKKIGVVVLSNSRANAYASLTDVALNLLDASYPLTVVKRPASVSAESMNAFAGRYGSADENFFAVRVQSGRLVFRDEASGFEFTPDPGGERRFAGLDVELGPPPVRADFIYNGFVKVVAMEWTQAGVTVDFSRLPDPVLMSIERAGAEVVLRVVGNEGELYQIEGSTDGVVWRDLGEVASGVGEKRIPVNAVGAPVSQMFRALSAGVLD